ncbi:hypothetical protein FRB90_005187 [Tulasnella sp. 427]|nr:hypothetical protein FRB90_005187 [Tulasnella sp. 427]
MFTRAKEKIRGLVSSTKPQKIAAPETDGESKDRASSPPVKRPFKVPTSPQNDTLPAEVLINIFDALIAISYDPSPNIVAVLSLVCRSWQNAGRGMELLRISISTSHAMDALLERIHKTPLFQTQSRANIRMLTVQCRYRQELHRIEELLSICRTSLEQLVLSRDVMDPSKAELLENVKQEAGEDVYFPNVKSLSLSEFGAQELHNFITAVDPAKLESLHIRDTFFWYDYDIPEELDNLRFPILKEIRIDGYCRAENPTVAWLFRVAPNLEMLELSIRRPSLPSLTQRMESEEILRGLKVLKLWIKIDKYDDLDPKSEDLAGLVALIKRRGWKQWICVHMSCGSCVSSSAGLYSQARQEHVDAVHGDNRARLAQPHTPISTNTWHFRPLSACVFRARSVLTAPANAQAMFVRVKDKIRGLVSGTKPQKPTAAKKIKASSRPLTRPFKVPTSPQNDTLPAEVLINIFDALIAISYDPSPKVMETLSLVCRSWQNASRGMELLRISISTSQAIDALLEHIQTTPLFRTQNRADIRMLNVECRYQEQLYRMEELLLLCRNSLQKLVLGRDVLNTSNADLLQNAKQEAGDDFYFPNVTELYNFITAVDPSRLEYLRIWDTFFWYDYDIPGELDNLRFPLLKEIRIDGYCRDENPTTPWLFRVAPNLELLELSIRRPSLRTFTRRMRDEEILGSLKTLKLWIRIDKYDDLDPRSEDLAPLVAVIKRRGWKLWICIHMSCGSWRVLLPTIEFKALINNLNVGSTNELLMPTSM